jgi:hypothetical protein
VYDKPALVRICFNLTIPASLDGLSLYIERGDQQ